MSLTLFESSTNKSFSVIVPAQDWKLRNQMLIVFSVSRHSWLLTIANLRIPQFRKRKKLRFAKLFSLTLARTHTRMALRHQFDYDNWQTPWLYVMPHAKHYFGLWLSNHSVEKEMHFIWTFEKFERFSKRAPLRGPPNLEVNIACLHLQWMHRALLFLANTLWIYDEQFQ